MFTDELDNSWMEEGVSVACCVELNVGLRREMSVEKYRENPCLNGGPVTWMSGWWRCEGMAVG